MGTFLLILLLLAAAFGVLGAVLKVAVILVLSFILAVVLLLWGGAWFLRHRMRTWQRASEREVDLDRRRRSAYDVGDEPPAGPAGELGEGS